MTLPLHHLTKHEAAALALHQARFGLEECSDRIGAEPHIVDGMGRREAAAADDVRRARLWLDSMAPSAIPGASSSFEARLWAHVSKDGPTLPGMASPCWMWTGTRRPDGYGVVGIASKATGLIRVHRAVWLLENGPIPDGLFACHRCDNPQCCNPAHIFLGTAGDNARDKEAKGRGSPPPVRRGLANNKAKLAPWQIEEIMTSTRSGADLAREFGVIRGSVNQIRKRRGYTGTPVVDRRGSKSARATISESQVLEIKRRLAAGDKGVSLAAEYGVSKSIISHIATGRAWGHIPWPDGVSRPKRRANVASHHQERSAA